MKDDPERVAQLIADLGSEKFPVRERATQELEYDGKYIKRNPEKALADKPCTESNPAIA